MSAHANVDLVSQALDNLVNQFARPLDFLRELVQNSIDAGSPRVEVRIRHEQGVTTVFIEDWGTGMDEAIIDGELTRMFASSKEDDLSKIGKFGIGFTSIFAVRPKAVLLKTGRGAESWEVLFKEDRSFDKVRISEPVHGTKVTLYLEMDQAEVAAFVEDCHWTLEFWCEHSDTPVLFFDETQQRTAPQGDHADPFAAFADQDRVGPDHGVRVSRPLGLDADLVVHMAEDGVEVFLGLAGDARFGFYNGGLTLVNTQNTDVLGKHAGTLGHMRLKVKYDRLEHTLTRDNVIQDEHWQLVMKIVLKAAHELRQRLIERCSQAAVSGEALDKWTGWLARECRVTNPGIDRTMDSFDALQFRDWKGDTVAWTEMIDQENELDLVLMDSGDEALNAALDREGLHVLDNRRSVRTLLGVTQRRIPWHKYEGVIERGTRAVVDASSAFYLPRIVRDDELSADEERLLRTCRKLVAAVTRSRVRVVLGELGAARSAFSRPVALDGDEDGEVFQHPRKTRFRLARLLRRRRLLVNREHPTWRATVVAGRDSVLLAALGLAQLLLSEEGLEGERTFAALIDEAWEQAT